MKAKAKVKTRKMRKTTKITEKENKSHAVSKFVTRSVSTVTVGQAKGTQTATKRKEKKQLPNGKHLAPMYMNKPEQHAEQTRIKKKKNKNRNR